MPAEACSQPRRLFLGGPNDAPSCCDLQHCCCSFAPLQHISHQPLAQKLCQACCSLPSPPKHLLSPMSLRCLRPLLFLHPLLLLLLARGFSWCCCLLIQRAFLISDGVVCSHVNVSKVIVIVTR